MTKTNGLTVKKRFICNTHKIWNQKSPFYYTRLPSRPPLKMKEEFLFTNRRGAKITGLRISDPLSELPDVRISPAGKHRIDIPVLILHNHSTASSGILLVSDLTRIKQKTSVKSNQTAFVSGVPECKLENKVFDKDELFIVRLKKKPMHHTWKYTMINVQDLP